MTNLDFFKAYFNNEFKATYDIINAIPVDKMHYKPHPINRSAYELAEHIVAHVYDFNLMINNGQFDEKLEFPFENPSELALKMKGLWEQAQKSLESLDDKQWEEETVELLITHFGSVKKVMEAKNEELIKLIGKSKTEKIKKS